MCLLVLATVTSDGRPICGKVDGVFYRGSFHCGSAHDSIRFRQSRQRPQVSATHLPGEPFSVTVHGTAELIDIAAPAHTGFGQTLLDTYTPWYGSEWEGFLTAEPRRRVSMRTACSRLRCKRLRALREVATPIDSGHDASRPEASKGDPPATGGSPACGERDPRGGL